MDICFDTTQRRHMESFTALGHICRAGHPHQLPAALPAGSAQQRCFMIVADDGEPRARIVAENTELRWREQRVGLLGYYEATESATPTECRRLFDAACAYLGARDCEIAIGPVNGSTWSSYRFSEPNGTRPFLLDVEQPDRYPVQWRSAGFIPVERYLSYVFEGQGMICDYGSDSDSERRTAGYGARMARRGITVESLHARTFEADLAGIHALCLAAFTANPLFTDIDFDAFAELYRPAAALVDPRWTLLAKDRDGNVQGFAFAYPDLFDPAGSTLIVKTVACRPGSACRGLGIWLTRRLHERARSFGMKRVIHALMHERNESTLAGAAAASVHRHYVLLGRSL